MEIILKDKSTVSFPVFEGETSEEIADQVSKKYGLGANSKQAILNTVNSQLKQINK